MGMECVAAKRNNTSRALSMSWVSSNAPSLEAVTEFTVDTNGFKAEYGHAGGGVGPASRGGREVHHWREG